MRFVAAVLAAGLVVSVAPADAAVKVEGFGFGTATYYGYDPIAGTSTITTRTGPLGIRAVVDDDVFAPRPGSSGSFGFTIGSSWSASFALTADPDQNLLAGGTATGSFSILELHFRGTPLFTFSGPATFVTTRVDEPTTGYSTFAFAVPEPATWAMMIAGFGAVGASLRRRQAYATS